MPLVVVSVNAPVPDASKKALAKDLGHIIGNDLKVRKQGHMVAGNQQARVRDCLLLGSCHGTLWLYALLSVPLQLDSAAPAGVSCAPVPLSRSLLQIPQQHVHIQVQDGQFISFAGDPDAPAVTVRGDPTPLHAQTPLSAHSSWHSGSLPKNTPDLLLPPLQHAPVCPALGLCQQLHIPQQLDAQPCNQQPSPFVATAVSCLSTRTSSTKCNTIHHNLTHPNPTPGPSRAQVAVKCAYNSIDRDARTRLVNAFAPAFTHAVKGLTPDRVYLTFEELPVQHMAPGTSIMVFDTMHTAPSSGELATPPAPITPA